MDTIRLVTLDIFTLKKTEKKIMNKENTVSRTGTLTLKDCERNENNSKQI